MKINDWEWYMAQALEEAERGFLKDEVPVGAIVIDGQGEILSKSHNLKEQRQDPTGHAEMEALKKASVKLKGWRLTDAVLITTLEPCPMCLGAMINARIKRLVFGAYDKKGGAISLGVNLYKNALLNHCFGVMGGIKQYQCAKILSDFFKQKRSRYKSE